MYNVPSAPSAPCPPSVLHDTVTFISSSGDNEAEFSFCADDVYAVPNGEWPLLEPKPLQVEEGSVSLSAQPAHEPLLQIQLSMAKQTGYFQSQAVPCGQIVACSSGECRILQRTAMLSSRIAKLSTPQVLSRAQEGLLVLSL